jgi:hypothetical protein
MKLVHPSALVLVGLVLSSACSGSSDGSAGSECAPGAYASKRTAPCRVAQDAICDHVADRCGTATREECEATARSTFCESDAAADACSAALQASSATCPDLPTECQTLIDRAPVQQFCNDLFGHCASYSMRCGGAAPDDCWPELHANTFYMPCYSTGIGISDCADRCLADIAAAACGSPFPASCEKVVIVVP